MSLSWGAYVALSVAILIFLVHDELETFSATSDTMLLVPARSQLRAAVTRCDRCGLTLFLMTPPGTRTPPKDPRLHCTPQLHCRPAPFTRTVGAGDSPDQRAGASIVRARFQRRSGPPGGCSSTHLYHCAASQKLQGRTVSRSNMTGNCFLTLLEDQFVLTVVHPAQPLGPQHTCY